MATSPLPASQFILQSFNLLDPTLANDLSQIANNLIDVRLNPLPSDYFAACNGADRAAEGHGDVSGGEVADGLVHAALGGANNKHVRS